MAVAQKAVAPAQSRSYLEQHGEYALLHMSRHNDSHKVSPDISAPSPLCISLSLAHGLERGTGVGASVKLVDLTALNALP